MPNKCFVCMTVYNGEAHLRESMDSVLAQEGAEIRFSIVDDGSTDGSAAILREYARRDPERVFGYESAWNEGIGTALGRALARYDGEDFFAMIGQDDIWEPGFLASQMAALERADAIVAFSQVAFIDDSGGKIAGKAGLFRHKRLEGSDPRELLTLLIRGNFLCAVSSVISVRKLEKRGDFPHLFGIRNDCLQDYELWLNLCLRGRFIYNRSAAVRYRLHENNASNTGRRRLQRKLEYYGALERSLDSDAFWVWLETLSDPAEGFCDAADAVWAVAEYINPCRLLTLRLCEEALARGYDTPRLRERLAEAYEDFGLLTKAYGLVGKLPRRITASFAGAEDEKLLRDAVDASGLFELKTPGTPGTLRLGHVKNGQIPPNVDLVIADDPMGPTDVNTLVLVRTELNAKHVLPFVEDRYMEFRNGILETYPKDNTLSRYRSNLARMEDLMNSRLYRVCRRLLKKFRGGSNR